MTTVGFNCDGNRLVNQCSSPDYVVTAAEGCLRRLGTDWVDLMLIHRPDHNTPYGEPIAALGKLKQDGKIRHYGVSNFSPAMMDVCESTGHLAANHVGYHLFDRRVAIPPAPQQDQSVLMCASRRSWGLIPPRGPNLKTLGIAVICTRASASGAVSVPHACCLA